MDWLLGIDIGALGRAAGWRVEFLRGPGNAIILLILAAAVAYAAILYRLRRGDCSAKHLLAMCVLRSAALVILLLMIFQPALIMETEISTTQPLAIVVDNSLSMEIRDAAGDPDYERTIASLATAPALVKPADLTRLAIAQALVDRPSTGLADALKKRYAIELYGVAQELKPVEQTAVLKTEGLSTRIGDALTLLAQGHLERPLAGIVLLSDGQSNEGVALGAAARKLASADIPVWCVAVARPKPIVDVAVSELTAPDVVAKGSTGKLDFQVRRAPPGPAATVRATLEKNGKVVETRQVALQDGASTAAGSFEITAPSEASDNYKVILDPLQGEINTANNSKAVTVRLASRKLKVLVVEGRPRWQFRYLKNALLRDPNFQAAVFMQPSKLEFAREGNLDELSKLPETTKELGALDVIVLGDVDPGVFTAAQLELFRDFIDKMAGGLIFAAGEQFNPAAYVHTALGPLIPFETEPPGKWLGGSQILMPVQDHPITSLADQLDGNRILWSALPELWNVYHGGRLKAGATVLMESKTAVPAVVIQQFGSGRVLFVGTDDTWRWRYRQPAERADKNFWRFWRQALMFAAGAKVAESRVVAVETDRKNYSPGEKPVVMLTLRDKDFQPIVLSEVAGEVRSADKLVDQVKLEPVPGRPGFYRSTINALPDGSYEVRVKADYAGEAGSAPFDVASPTVEFADINLNRKGLQALAEATGGAYFDPGQTGDLVKRLAAGGRSLQMRNTVTRLWHAPILFLLLIGAVAAEWILRKFARLL